MREPLTIAGIALEKPCERCNGTQRWGHGKASDGGSFHCDHCNGGLVLTTDGETLKDFVLEYCRVRVSVD